MELVIYSEGSMSYTETMLLSYSERQLFAETLTEYFKKKAGQSSEEYL